LEKYTPLYHVERTLPWQTGLDKFAREKQCLYVYKRGKEMVLPMMNFALATNGFTQGKWQNNDVNQKCIDDLDNLDFLIVRKYELVLVPEN